MRQPARKRRCRRAMKSLPSLRTRAVNDPRAIEPSPKYRKCIYEAPDAFLLVCATNWLRWRCICNIQLSLTYYDTDIYVVTFCYQRVNPNDNKHFV